jgi:hypothetical protein
LTQRPGSYRLLAAYAGAEGVRLPSEDAADFTVEPEDSEISLTLAGKGSKRTLTARLDDPDDAGGPIAGRTIVFFADGERLGEATTDAQGIARLTPLPGQKSRLARASRATRTTCPHRGPHPSSARHPQAARDGRGRHEVVGGELDRLRIAPSFFRTSDSAEQSQPESPDVPVRTLVLSAAGSG